MTFMMCSSDYGKQKSPVKTSILPRGLSPADCSHRSFNSLAGGRRVPAGDQLAVHDRVDTSNLDRLIDAEPPRQVSLEHRFFAYRVKGSWPLLERRT
jgi:hypothetical protein